MASVLQNQVCDWLIFARLFSAFVTMSYFSSFLYFLSFLFKFIFFRKLELSYATSQLAMWDMFVDLSRSEQFADTWTPGPSEHTPTNDLTKNVYEEFKKNAKNKNLSFLVLYKYYLIYTVLYNNILVTTKDRSQFKIKDFAFIQSRFTLT